MSNSGNRLKAKPFTSPQGVSLNSAWQIVTFGNGLALIYKAYSFRSKSIHYTLFICTILTPGTIKSQ